MRKAKAAAGNFISGVVIPFISVRITLLLFLGSMLPLAILAIDRGRAQLSSDIAVNNTQLSQQALMTALVEGRSIRRAQYLLAVAALDPRLRGTSTTACNAAVQSLRNALPGYANFFRTNADGDVICAARGDSADVNLTAHHWLQQLRSGKPFVLSNPLRSPILQRQVIVAAQRLARPDGSFDGALAASIDFSWVDDLLKAHSAANSRPLIITDGQGKVIRSSRDIDWKTLDVSGPAGSPHLTFDASGRRWAYAAAPIYTGEDQRPGLLVGYAAPRPTLRGPGNWAVIQYFALPAAALVLASLALAFGAHWSILRWITALRKLIGAYAIGDFNVRVDRLSAAPAEVRELADSLHSMAVTIDDRDQALVAALNRQRALGREIHHRVKNNLQIVVSILALKARAVGPGPGQQALDHARVRISALALVHRLLFESAGETNVQAGRLVSELCQQLRRNWPHADGIELSCHADDLPLDIEAAVPITLWIVEAVSNVLTHAYAAGSFGKATFRLSRAGEELLLSLTDDGLGFDTLATSSRNGLRTMAAIARQLGGSMTIESEPGRTRVEMRVSLARIASASEAIKGIDNGLEKGIG